MTSWPFTWVLIILIGFAVIIAIAGIVDERKNKGKRRSWGA